MSTSLMLSRNTHSRLGVIHTPNQTLRRWILASLAEMGGEAPRREVLERIEERYGDLLTQADLGSPESRPHECTWENNASWERDHMVKEGVLAPHDGTKSLWKLTQFGWNEARASAAEPPDEESAAVGAAGIGIRGSLLDSSQHRFWFIPKNPTSDIELFDRVSGVLLRETDPRFLVRALWLYESRDGSGDPRSRTFMLLLGNQPRSSGERPIATDAHADERGLDAEYERIGRLVVSTLGDTKQEHFPPVV